MTFVGMHSNQFFVMCIECIVVIMFCLTGTKAKLKPVLKQHYKDLYGAVPPILGPT